MFEYCRFYIGQHQSPGRLLQQLLDAGYERVGEVLDPGQCAMRGGIVDVFPATFESPLRLEVDGARIASIRSFNPKTTETLDRHTMVVVLPRRVRLHPSAEVPFETFVDLREGDYVVHLDHGIGRYVGRTTIHGSHGPQDALELEYADGDRLYVPLDQLHLVQKYVAFGARQPTLHKLGGAAWQRQKANAYVGAWMYAKSLLELQAKRLTLPGYAFGEDHEWQQPFEAAFAYRETPDQFTAVAEVKRDMEQGRPMDRLLLGDVGFGKTEVAIRAAFKAVTHQKQVAVLVPTTILAYQHYRTFSRRMEAFAVHVAMLTRFQTDAEQAQTLRALAEGRCDLVIGTHRLLSGDVRFKELGLLIIDEEQRFGVKDKERLKQWRTQVDVLTLSATPIPRTLYLALAGAREMSLIATPPEMRHPVETHVVDEDEASLREWILKELRRHGQVYVVHNRVHNIYRIAEQLEALVPEARIGVAHGQMAEDALEQVIIAFMDGQLDVLVTTTIIESGIDIPNANTLIVHAAERFGLAELYQLRGRVGRFDRRAYAYLVVSKRATVTAEARRRLEAMAEHTALGSGFNIAMEDLKLRGAGNLLGVEQSGHVSAVGFDLYCRLLREAVGRLQGNEAAQRPSGPVGQMRSPAHRTAGPLTRLVLAVISWGLLCVGTVAAETANRIVAFVNDDIITSAEVSDNAQALRQQQGQPADAADEASLHQAVLEQLIEHRLILQEARRAGVVVESKDVLARLDDMRSRFESEDAFQASLAESGMTEEDLKERIREQLLAKQVVAQQVRTKILVSPQEVAKALGEQPQLAKAGDRVRMSHLLIRVNETRTEEEAKRLIQSIVDRLARGEDFAALAQRYSEDPHADEGGAMAWMAQGELMPQLDAVAFALKPGEVSQPIQTRLGFHLIRLEERRAASSLSLMEANYAVYQRIYQQKFEQAFKAWMQQLKATAYIHIVEPPS